jgi:hypothetical protein
MGKDMMAVLNRQLKSYKPRRRPVKPHLGFANKQEERIFRAFAAVYPKAVRITEHKWRLHADQHIKLGYASCAIYGAGANYKLTGDGVRHAIAVRLLKEPA